MQTGNTQEKKIIVPEKDEGLKDSLGDLMDHSVEYANTFYKLQLLNATKKATDVTANVLGGIVSLVVGLMFMVFGGMALAWWLGDLLGSRAGGFLAVAGFFALIGIIFMAIRKSVVFPMFRNKIIRKMYE